MLRTKKAIVTNPTFCDFKSFFLSDYLVGEYRKILSKKLKSKPARCQ